MCQGTTHADIHISLRNPYRLQVSKWVPVRGKDSECPSFPKREQVLTVERVTVMKLCWQLASEASGEHSAFFLILC